MSDTRQGMQSRESEPTVASYSNAFCGYCGERLPHSRAPLTQCPFCQTMFREARPTPAPTTRSPLRTGRLERTTRQREPALAAVLSAVLPGAGQVYNGQLFKGLFVFGTFWLVIPWLFGILDAYVTASRSC